MKPISCVRRVNWFVVIIAIAIASGCSGRGCSGCGVEAIPGGFALGKRTTNAGQVRISTSGIAKITADPAAVLGPLLGSGSGGTVAFPVPSSCSGTKICCDDNNQPIANCGPIAIDLSQHVGDSPRLTIAPSGANALAVTMNARVKTTNPIVVELSGAHCKIAIDTNGNPTPPDLQIVTTVTFSQDANNVTGIKASGTAITHLDSGDLKITPVNPLSSDALCYGAAFIPSSTITGFLTGPIEDAINRATCKSCAALSDCAPGASACTSGTCMVGSACQQELGIDGRMRGSSLFGSLSPGTTGALDLYEVAGGYAITNEAGGGISLGLLGGMEPGGTARDLCGPTATEPTFVASVGRSAYFNANTRPDTNAAYDVAIGLHKSQIAQLAYGGYEGGLFCITIGHNTAAQLTTDTIGLLSRSLGNLVEASAPMAIGLRPQSPPVMKLGKNTFTESGTTRTLTDPLLDITFSAMEIDFFAEVDNQYIRVFTVVADVHLPVGLDVGAAGTLTPVLGDVSNAFTNVSVKNADAVTEAPADLAALFPTLLNLVLPQLSGGLSPISLPALGGLSLSVIDLTSVDDTDSDGVGDFLALYANLVPRTMAAEHISTAFDVTSIDAVDPEVAKTPARWRDTRPPAVTLALGAVRSTGQAETRALEFQLRIDDGSWTAWSANARPVLALPQFFLPGIHHIEARARLKGQPDSADPSPAKLAVPMGTSLVPTTYTAPADPADPKDAPFHGSTDTRGCACNSSGGAGAAAPFGLLLLGITLPWRRLRRRATSVVRRTVLRLGRLGSLVWLAALACVPGCSCGSKPCGDATCMDGTQSGSIGRWTSIAGDDKRVLVATYDSTFGDLVIADVTDATTVTYKSIDGVPTDVTPTYDPSTWRGGIVDAGAKIGAYTSIVLADHKGHVSYQDRDLHQLKYASEDASGNWTSYVVDAGHGEQVGLFTSLVIDSSKQPVIAYMARGGDDGMGHRTSELRIARGASPTPGPTDWVITAIASTLASCAGLCGSEACIAGATRTDPPVCVAATTDCTPACAAGKVCSTGTCATAVTDSMLDDLPSGTGLFTKLLVLGDGRLAVVFYDRVRRALVLDAETGNGTSTFAETILDGNVAGADRGMWANAVLAGDGTVHVAYQDALADQLMYTTWNGTAGTPEVVDDGVRAGDRTHPVGQAASIYLASGAPTIAYQDALTSDVYLAQKGAIWGTNPIAQGPLLDGFSIAATTAHGAPVIAWESKDPHAVAPLQIGTLAVKPQ